MLGHGIGAVIEARDALENRWNLHEPASRFEMRALSVQAQASAKVFVQMGFVGKEIGKLRKELRVRGSFERMQIRSFNVHRDEPFQGNQGTRK